MIPAGFTDELGVVFSAGVLASGIRLAVPTALAAIGEAVSQRAGIFNLGLEGMMMMGAFAGFAATSSGMNPALGLAIGALAGAALASLMVFGSVFHGTNVIVTGFSLVLLGQGLANFLYAQRQESLPSFGPLNEIDLGPLRDIPLLGSTVFNQNALFPLMLVLALFVAALLSRTRFGLEVDASGSDPRAAEAKGVSVRRTRTIAVLRDLARRASNGPRSTPRSTSCASRAPTMWMRSGREIMARLRARRQPDRRLGGARPAGAGAARLRPARRGSGVPGGAAGVRRSSTRGSRSRKLPGVTHFAMIETPRAGGGGDRRVRLRAVPDR